LKRWFDGDSKEVLCMIVWESERRQREKVRRGLCGK